MHPRSAKAPKDSFLILQKIISTKKATITAP